MIYPVKYNSKVYNDKRGYLREITPRKINSTFIYSILTNSKKNVLRGMHYNNKMDEELLVSHSYTVAYVIIYELVMVV